MKLTMTSVTIESGRVGPAVYGEQTVSNGVRREAAPQVLQRSGAHTKLQRTRQPVHAEQRPGRASRTSRPASRRAHSAAHIRARRRTQRGRLATVHCQDEFHYESHEEDQRGQVLRAQYQELLNFFSQFISLSVCLCHSICVFSSIYQFELYYYYCFLSIF